MSCHTHIKHPDTGIDIQFHGGGDCEGDVELGKPLPWYVSQGSYRAGHLLDGVYQGYSFDDTKEQYWLIAIKDHIIVELLQQKDTGYDEQERTLIKKWKIKRLPFYVWSLSSILREFIWSIQWKWNRHWRWRAWKKKVDYKNLSAAEKGINRLAFYMVQPILSSPDYASISRKLVVPTEDVSNLPIYDKDVTNGQR